ncbi:delta-60 repeat domain-containing protein [Nocardia sp. NBC_01499]|uniref:delta-60 repeat domain-containing protein n=1 Tax=Nocardia sp. NBC_01499 TaxID=2903597 RepID=UPI0038666754
MVQNDRKIIAVGTSHGTSTGDDIAVARYTSTGQLDTTFGDRGKVSTDLGTQADHAHAVALESDGKVVVAGSTHDPAQGDNFAIVRYTTDGKLDTGFGDSGKVSTDFGGKSDVANAVAIQPDSKIVAVGTSRGASTGDDFAVARYTSSGQLDATFGKAGTVSTDLGSQSDRADAVALQSDGKIVVAGVTSDPALGDNFAIVRYQG